jgi:hypothetical protein
MGNTLKTYRRVISILGVLTLVAGLAACTTAGPDIAASSDATPSRTPSATASPTVPADGAPAIDPAVTAAWAAEAVPTRASDGFIMAQNGRFQDDALGSFTLSMSTLPAGSYSVYLACRGDADTTVTLAVDNVEESTLAGGCSDVSQGMTFSTTADGATFRVLGDREAPVEWAFAVTGLLPGANG